MSTKHPIEKAAEVVGSKAALARLLNVTKAAVGQWTKEGRRVPVSHCVSIETATKGQVTRQELRPDDWQQIWPELAKRRRVTQ